MSDLLGPRARSTRRLGEMQGRVGIACGGAGGARLLTHLRMPASRTTVLRLVRAMPIRPPSTPACCADRGPWLASPDDASPVHVGVDDWAMRRGCSTVFAFRSKRADRLKLLFFDGAGVVLVAKRLAAGAFR